ncbi:MAG: SH3 domain-containing protein [Planctomycetaceae bacterium]|nr:SH3 domain-containing protein [Planctomycetaceae bacterium]
MPPRFIALALIASGLSIGLGGSPLRGDEQFPYRGFVNANDVYLRSGPGQNYYPTEKLPYGTELEVWRHDPGGWYAVRPTEKSYSWISAEFLQPTADGLGEITGDNVVVRVGSEFSDVRDVIQLHLNRGEEVEVREAKRIGSGPGAQTWYKIAPPAGEFRWVHGKYIDQDLERAAADRRQPARNRLLPDEDDDDDATAADESRQVDHTASVAAGRDRDGSTDEAGEATDADHEDPRTKPSRNSSEETPSPTVGTRTERQQSLDRELDDLNAALSKLVAEEPTAWSFEDLRARAEAALEQGSTAIQRGRARLILSKIERFEDVKQRMAKFEKAVSESERLEMMASARTRRNVGGPRFDGVGRLARVQSKTPGVPAYALTDPSGAIRYYVTPAPGVNLQHYVGREIGVSGGSGYIPELRGRSVTAQRVMPLDDRRWR